MQCPTCLEEVDGEPYDIGSGPELACPHCETCFGALGQPLKPLDMEAIRKRIIKDHPDEFPPGHWIHVPPVATLEL